VRQTSRCATANTLAVHGGAITRRLPSVELTPYRRMKRVSLRSTLDLLLAHKCRLREGNELHFVEFTEISPVTEAWQLISVR
jgi:hypothetical protein